VTRRSLLLWRRDPALPEVPQPPVAPDTCGATTLGPVAGRYLASTSAQQWLDRVTAHGLGPATPASLVVRTDGVLIARETQPDVYLPRDQLREVRLDRSIGGNVYEVDGVLVLTWQVGPRLLDTGFRAAVPDDHAAILGAVRPLVGSSR
jgi:hypothetical protein